MRIVDTHNHFVPREALDVLASAGCLSTDASGDPVYRPSPHAPGITIQAELHREELQLRQHNACFTDTSLMPPPFLMLYGQPGELGVPYARAYNEGLARFAREHAGFFGLAALPLQDPPAAAAELERAVTTLGLRGAAVVPPGSTELSDQSLWPVWDVADALDVPVFIHPGTGMQGFERMNRYHLRNLVGNPTETALAAAFLIFSGTLDRFPRLTFELAHSGGSLPWLIGRYEHGYLVRPECRGQKSSPLSCLRRFYYDTLIFEPVALRFLVERVGADRVMLGTDWPFDMADLDMAGTVRAAGLGDAANRQILSENAARLFRL